MKSFADPLARDCWDCRQAKRLEAESFTDENRTLIRVLREHTGSQSIQARRPETRGRQRF